MHMRPNSNLLKSVCNEPIESTVVTGMRTAVRERFLEHPRRAPDDLFGKLRAAEPIFDPANRAIIRHRAPRLWATCQLLHSARPNNDVMFDDCERFAFFPQTGHETEVGSVVGHVLERGFDSILCEGEADGLKCPCLPSRCKWYNNFHTVQVTLCRSA